jgi:hypothetical protein
MATSVPFDEEEDAASVAKGLAMLHAHPELGPGEAFKGRAPVRSSLQTLRMPFEYAPLEDDEEEGATRSFRISEPKILEDGCYLIYDSSSGGTLVLHYSRHQEVENAIGFFVPGKDHKFQKFKYDHDSGYVELIGGIVGGEKNKRKYYSGWCQFIQLAKSFGGKVAKKPDFEQGIKVDIYGFKEGRVSYLDLNDKLQPVSDLEAVAVVPHGNDRFKGVHALTRTMFLDGGNTEGASMLLR